MTKSDEDAKPAQYSVLVNVLKLVFLVGVLIAAWFLLDWLINGK